MKFFEARPEVERGMYFVQLGCKLQTLTSMAASHEVSPKNLCSAHCASAHIVSYQLRRAALEPVGSNLCNSRHHSGGADPVTSP
jgi:hypothetical protein